MMSSTPQTPLGQSTASLAPDTSLLVRQTSQYKYSLGDLESCRRILVEDLGSLLEIPFDHLIQRLHPHDPNGPPINNILGALKTQDIVQGDRWKSFLQSPSLSPVVEKETFAPLSEIINGVFQHIPTVSLSYINDGRSPLSERKNSSIPDGFFKLVKTKTVRPSKDVSRTHWFDIAVPFEFKKLENERGKNERQIIWGLHCIMREDPCRRFAYGITIEGENLRVWLTNRAYLVVTQSINFCTDLRRVISLFYSLGSASDVQLGWDYTIERVSISGKNQYRIYIEDMRFTTVEELATYGAESMIGRGTRVWRAKDEEGNIVAIKDGWRDLDRLSEGEILERVLEAIKAKFPDEFDEAKKHFVSVRKFGDVHLGDVRDETLDLNSGSARDVLPAGYKWIKVTKDVTVSMSHSPKAHLPNIGDIPCSDDAKKRAPYQKQENARIPRRVHCRIAFNDVGTTIQELKSLRDVIDCLSGACTGLYYMHLVGWVHRDISTRNLLWVSVGDRRVGKLMDFEYAKSIDCDVSHDVRTGTVNFMACEVRGKEYAFGNKNRTGATRRPKQRPMTVVPFRMNFLHDLESIFWTIVWVLYCHTDAHNRTSDPGDRLYKFQDLFPGDSLHRLLFLEGSVDMAPYVLADDFGNVASCLPTIAERLCLSFITMEESNFQNNAKDDSVIKATHEVIREAFSQASEELRSGDIQLILVSDVLKEENSPGDEDSSPARKRRRH